MRRTKSLALRKGYPLLRLRPSKAVVQGYKVDTDTIALKGKQGFAAREKAKRVGSPPRSITRPPARL
jgi:hypothetical protein